ncbi:MAG TPA: pyridoxal phosphate-dependent aminotransferase [Mycobacteriales bacterium]
MATRLRQFSGTTIFSEMTALAQATGAINLGQGFPDSDGPPGLLAAAREAIASGHNQYPPATGIPELRAQIAARRSADHGVAYDPATEIVVTTGATEALTAAMIGLCDPDDEVIVFDPLYDSYAAAIAMAGARLRPVPLAHDGDRFAFDLAALRGAVGPRTRLLLLNSPHNPTGKVFDPAELAQIADLCVTHDLVAVTDEVYEYLVYDGVRHVPLASLPGMRDRTVTISSAGKTFSVTGWKIGWACGPAHLVDVVRTVKQYVTFATGTPFQHAVARALRDDMDWVARQRDSLQHRRDLLVDALRAAGITTYDSQGTYFVQFDARSLGHDDGLALCRELVEQAGVVAIPGVALYHDKEAGRHLVRLAFCKSEETLTAASERLTAYARAVRGGQRVDEQV